VNWAIALSMLDHRLIARSEEQNEYPSITERNYETIHHYNKIQAGGQHRSKNITGIYQDAGVGTVGHHRQRHNFLQGD